MNRQLVIHGLIRWAVTQNAADPVIPLTGIQTTLVASGVQSGQMLVGVNEAGGTAKFTLLPGMAPQDIIALCEECIQWINQQPDKTKLRMNQRRLMRLQAGFGGYSRSWDAQFDRKLACLPSIL